MKEDTTTIDPTWMERTGGYARDKTLRDEFAGRAMQGYAASDFYVDPITGEDMTRWVNADDMARAAYAVADAMLKARDAK